MDRLSPLDAAFLEAEDADRHTSMAIASIAVFEGPAPSLAEFTAVIRARIPAVTRYRQKVRRVPGDLGAPRWVDDPDFDLAWHVRHTALPAPGDDAALAALMGRVMSQRLDRDRPLWEYWLVDGLRDGHWALISKLHHSMVDGVSGTDLYRVILDRTPDPRPAEPDDWHPLPEPTTFELLRAAAGDLAALPVREAAALADSLRRPAVLRRTLTDTVRGLPRYWQALVPATASSLSGPVGQHRRFTWARASLGDVATVRRAFGGTLNDVVLAAVTGGMRELVLAHGERPERHALRSLVPVSVRAPGEEGIYDNRVSSLLAWLPVHLEDPVDALVSLQLQLAELKASGEAEAGAVVTAVSRYEPFPLVAAPLRVAFRYPLRAITTVTTNVPGPRAPLYAAGRRLVEIIPYVPIAKPARVGVSIFTYCDDVRFGITADWASVPDVDVLAGGIEETLGALVKRALER